MDNLNVLQSQRDGYVGHLNHFQESKLKRLWTLILDFLGENTVIAQASKDDDSRSMSSGRSSGPDNRVDTSSASPSVSEVNLTDNEAVQVKAAHHEFNVPTDEARKDAYKHSQNLTEVHQLRRKYTRIQIRVATYFLWGSQDPDACLLSYLRSRDWNVDRAFALFFTAVKWYLDKDIDGLLQIGEQGIDRNDPNFKRQFGSGKYYISGHDLEGRPVVVIHQRLHHVRDQSRATVDKFIAYNAAILRKAFVSPVESCLIIVDLDGYGLKNIDYHWINEFIRVFHTLQGQGIHRVLLHRAPRLAMTVWSIIKGFLDKDYRKRVVFTHTLMDLTQYVALEHLPRQLGGQNVRDWVYLPPSINDTVPRIDDQVTRDRLTLEMRFLNAEYEYATRRWINAESTGTVDYLKAARRGLRLKRLIKMRELDPYLYPASVYERQGSILEWERTLWTYEYANGHVEQKRSGRTSSSIEWEMHQLENGEDEQVIHLMSMIRDLKMQKNGKIRNDLPVLRRVDSTKLPTLRRCATSSSADFARTQTARSSDSESNAMPPTPDTMRPVLPVQSKQTETIVAESLLSAKTPEKLGVNFKDDASGGTSYKSILSASEEFVEDDASEWEVPWSPSRGGSVPSRLFAIPALSTSVPPRY